MKFLVPNYSCLQNSWLGGYRPQIPVLSVLNWICWTPPLNKIPGYATVLMTCIGTVCLYQSGLSASKFGLHFKECKPVVRIASFFGISWGCDSRYARTCRCLTAARQGMFFSSVIHATSLMVAVKEVIGGDAAAYCMLLVGRWCSLWWKCWQSGGLNSHVFVTPYTQVYQR